MSLVSHSPSVGQDGRRRGEWGTTPARRRQILDAALQCFEKKGVAATTVEDICDVAALSVGSIYHHFGGKEEICDYLVREAMAEYRAGLVAALGAWLRREAQAERIQRMHPDLYSALFMGPLMEHARERSSGLTTASPSVLEDGLVQGLLRVLAP